MYRTQDWLLNCIYQVCWSVCWISHPHAANQIWRQKGKWRHMQPQRLDPPHMKLKGSRRIWRFKYGGRRPNVVACDHKCSSICEAERKPSHVAIQIWRQTERRPSHVTIQIWRQKDKCRRMRSQRLGPPHVKLKGSCRVWRFRYGGRRRNAAPFNHMWGGRKAIQMWGLKPADVCEHSHVTANKATIKSITCVQSNMAAKSRHMWAFHMRAGKT